MFALSGWHNAAFHIDRAEVIVAGQHVHAEDPKNDPDSPIHVAAHSLNQGIAIPSTLDAPMPLAKIVRAWIVPSSTLTAGLSPPSLLRPPRG